MNEPQMNDSETQAEEARAESAEEAQPESAEEAQAGSPTRAYRKVRQGVVVSDRSEKTVVVRVDRRFAHPLYGKSMTGSKRYHAHDETNEYRVGDVVRIQETRPLSKLKRWRVVDLVERPERV